MAEADPGTLADGLTVRLAAEFLGFAPRAAFRLRHRFLSMPRGAKPESLASAAEMDTTYFLELYKGRKIIGCVLRKGGLPREQTPVLVARDRSGATTDYVLINTRKPAMMALPKPLLPPGASSISQGTGLEHHLEVAH